MDRQEGGKIMRLSCIPCEFFIHHIVFGRCNLRAVSWYLTKMCSKPMNKNGDTSHVTGEQAFASFRIRR